MVYKNIYFIWTIQKKGNKRWRKGEKKEEKTDTYDKDINNKISISKSMTGATENGVVTDPSNIPWKLVVNESKRASMSGKTITDTIDPNSQAYMH